MLLARSVQYETNKSFMSFQGKKHNLPDFPSFISREWFYYFSFNYFSHKGEPFFVPFLIIINNSKRYLSLYKKEIG